MIRPIIITYLLLLSSFGALAQSDYIERTRSELMRLSGTQPGLLEPVELSVSNASIQEFVRGVASSSGINITVSQDIEVRITNSFNSASVIDIILFLCKEYQLEVDVTGTILSLHRHVPEPEPIIEEVFQELDIVYKPATDLLSINVKSDNLFEVSKRITELSDYNVVIAPGIEMLSVSSFIKNRPFQQALENFAFANGLIVIPKEGKFFVLEEASEAEKNTNKPEFGRNTNQITEASRPIVQGLYLKRQDSTITIRATDVDVSEIIMSVSHELGVYYYLFSSPDIQTTLYVENATFDEFLQYVLSGTDHTFKVRDGIYLIGKRTQEHLRTTDLITLEHRTVEHVIDIIPQELKAGVTIKEFSDLNGLIITGSYVTIEEIRTFLRKVDRPVPVILIDIMIIEVRKDFTLESGLRLSLGGDDVPTNSTGVYNGASPGIDATISSKTLNDLLRSFSVPGLVNLGVLSPNFYASIKALESNGYIKRSSTPKLATMNGSEATLSIGEQTFYAETSNSFIGAQNPALSESRIYKPINADLSITITPFVSSDEQITLSIDFSQSNFTNRLEVGAPPGSQTKSFNSKVRVRNGETVLLGGLDEDSTEKTGEGLPFISRIPVLRWFFGNNTKRDSKSQINIFIQSTVIY